MKMPLTSLTLRKGSSRFLLNRSVTVSRVKALPWMRRQYASEAQQHVEEPSTDSFLQGNTATYVENMYAAWKNDPSSVHSSWQAYFDGVYKRKTPLEQVFQPPPGLISSKPIDKAGYIHAPVALEQSRTGRDQIKVERLVQAYQNHGHTKADIDPLGLWNGETLASRELELEDYGFTTADLDRQFPLGPGLLPNFISDTQKSMSLKDIMRTCKTVYCGTYGVEYLHIHSRDEREWIRNRIERPNPIQYSSAKKRQILDRLSWSTIFERFLATKFPNAKRFSSKGVESQLPGLKALIDASAENGVRNIVFGCCHRGKTNVLSNIMRKPNELIFNEFLSSAPRYPIGGDVRYHLGMTHERETPSGNKVQLTVLPNPSHLEVLNAVAQGMGRAVQQQEGMDQKSTMVLNSHTDAAFSGQGVVYETLNLAKLKPYATGGTVHLVVNNQIGFTTGPESGRSTSYVSDVAKILNAPIFHVNADDVEAVTFICQLLADYRAKFKKDCMLDLVGYRKKGHNEIDQASYTQPIMYDRIANKDSQLDIYAAKLSNEGVVTQGEIEHMQTEIWNKLSHSFENSKDPEPIEREYLLTPWEQLKSPFEVISKVLPPRSTSVSHDKITTVAGHLGVPQKSLALHKGVKRALEKREQNLAEGRDIDWATAESLAFGTLCLEGYHVRLTGQDVERGTFSQRHAVLHDQKTGETYTPLDSLAPDQATFTVGNSSLSEVGVMGFDYGFSCMHPNALVMWEAQFGDFANNAQCVIDQLIASAENKWLQRSGMVLSLPHGFDGQGPEHSSARIERFLQLCNEDPRSFPSPEKSMRKHQDANIQIVYMTTPANMFHVLRRQLHRDFRKPLIIFFSKSLLRHPMVKSNLEDFTGESHFQDVIPDPEHGKSIDKPAGIKRVIYCTGQVYMTLAKYRAAHKITDTTITRVEQLHPFPWELVRDNLNQYPNATDIAWCQEEPFNNGVWSYSMPRIETVFDTTERHHRCRLRFAGRPPTSSVAAGSLDTHRAEEEAFLKDAFQVPGADS